MSFLQIRMFKYCWLDLPNLLLKITSMRESLRDSGLATILVRQSKLLVAGLLCVNLSNCGHIKSAVESDVSKVKKALGVKPELKDNQYSINENPNRRGALSNLGGAKVVTRKQELPSEDEIIWAPEDPDIPIAELEGVDVSTEPIDSWYDDFDEAMRQSRVTGKPVMMWFTRSRNSPLCDLLSDEFLSTTEFDEWASENVIRLRVDSNIKSSDTAKRRDQQRQVENLKKRFSVLGQPVMVMVSPRGTGFGKMRGYKRGSSQLYFGKLKNYYIAAKADYVSWKSNLEAKGYRVWHDAQGRTVFAKVARYKEGTLWLIEPDGKRSKTNVSKLSAEDRLYVERRIEASRAKKIGPT